MEIRPARTSDLSAVAALLSANNLPIQGVAENFADFIVADDGGKIIGAVGLEIFGQTALLRSAVIASDHRGTGTGHRLIETLLERARKAGIENIYLLTTSAEEYFPRFGFRQIGRDEAPAAIKGSVEFRGACPETATLMKLFLRDPASQSAAPDA